jgi:hypothetical protein
MVGTAPSTQEAVEAAAAKAVQVAQVEKALLF